MKTIIITGSIATGKSTVTNYLKDHNYIVIDTDLIARQVVEVGSNGLKSIQETFGNHLIQSDGSLNREALGHLIFNNEIAREQLNAILHPLIFAETQRQIQIARQSGAKVVFVDIPLFYEVAVPLKYDEVWLVYTPEAIQVERLMERNALTRQEACARINSQISIEKKYSKANVILENTGDFQLLFEQIADQLNKI